tara:strand:+ start:725 stop:898 length:174 start_codon:yes stop_codon:yes gene_type:complete
MLGNYERCTLLENVGRLPWADILIVVITQHAMPFISVIIAVGTDTAQNAKGINGSFG